MKKNRAIWGAGFLGGKRLLEVGKDNIDFFIDTNAKKAGTFFASKPVINPKDICDWNDLFIYVPESYFLSIEPILKQHNLKINRDYELFDSQTGFDYESMLKDYNRAMEALNNKKENFKNKIIFWGWDFSEKRNYNDYFKRIHESNSSFEYAVIAENLWSDIEEVEKKNGAPSIMAPNAFCYESFLTTLPCNCMHITQENKIISKAASLLQMFCEGASYECAVIQATFMLRYIEEVFKVVEPKYIVASLARNVRSMLLEYVCKEKNIIVYAAPGILPGTYTFDPYGESGHSIPNIDTTKFKDLYVSDNEKENAKEIVEELRISGENRKILQDLDDSTFASLKNNCPTILFIAQPDTDFTPYDEEVQLHYSPTFRTSREAGIYISRICKKNGWNYILKSHPMYVQRGIEAELPEDSIHIVQGNINAVIDKVDLVVTIQSSVSYTAMIRNKPVVMLGYNQMKGKECCYEAYVLNEIEETMKKALAQRITKEMRDNFVKHIAQLRKYYLYDDLAPKKNMRGKKLLNSIEDLFEICKGD